MRLLRRRWFRYWPGAAWGRVLASTIEPEELDVRLLFLGRPDSTKQVHRAYDGGQSRLFGRTLRRGQRARLKFVNVDHSQGRHRALG